MSKIGEMSARGKRNIGSPAWRRAGRPGPGQMPPQPPRVIKPTDPDLVVASPGELRGMLASELELQRDHGRNNGAAQAARKTLMEIERRG